MKALPITLAVVAFILAGLYFTGHGPLASHKAHPTHGVAFLVLGVLSLIWLRFQKRAGRSFLTPCAHEFFVGV